MEFRSSWVVPPSKSGHCQVATSKLGSGVTCCTETLLYRELADMDKRCAVTHDLNSGQLRNLRFGALRFGAPRMKLTSLCGRFDFSYTIATPSCVRLSELPFTPQASSPRRHP